jgi:hypothetical protein
VLRTRETRQTTCITRHGDACGGTTLFAPFTLLHTIALSSVLFSASAVSAANVGDKRSRTSGVLWGEKDAVFPRANQDRLRTAPLPGAAFGAYPKVGHNLHWEIPRQVAEDIVAFLQ